MKAKTDKTVWLLGLWMCGLLAWPGCTNHPAPQKKGKVVVEISQMTFQPAQVSAHTGDTIVFVNHDMVNHDITADPKSWTSGPLPPNESWTLIVTGSTAYFCSIHPSMKGKILVQ